MRPVSLRRDLGAVAELIEVCFGATMDESGRAAVREMRMISQSGPLLWLLSGLDRVVGGLEQGFVYFDHGQLIGNISLSVTYLPRPTGKGYIVANVATHPNYRRQGIAQRLMKASLGFVQQRGGRFALLQVDADNLGAQRLYQQLGFYEERTFTRWYRPSHLRVPVKLDEMPNITIRGGREWRAEYELARIVRPNRRGGMGWLQPTTPDRFQNALSKTLSAFLGGKNEERWIIREADARGIAASLHAVTSFGGSTKLTLLVHPRTQGQHELPLLNYALRRLEANRAPITIEHPADDLKVAAVLEDYGFERRQTLMHMRWDAPDASTPMRDDDPYRAGES